MAPYARVYFPLAVNATWVLVPGYSGTVAAVSQRSATAVLVHVHSRGGALRVHVGGRELGEDQTKGPQELVCVRP